MHSFSKSAFSQLWLFSSLMTLTHARPWHHQNRLPRDILPLPSPTSPPPTSVVIEWEFGTQTTTAATALVSDWQIFFAPIATPTPIPAAVPSEISVLLFPAATPTASYPGSSPSAAKAVPSPMVAAYYADWTADTLPPEQVDFDRLDFVDFAFAVPDQNFGLQFTEDNSEDLLTRLVTAGHAKAKGVKLSIGGWDGCAQFSAAVATNASRSTFANNIAAMYNQFNLDGVDIDWEYPGDQGAPGNAFSPSDTANLLSFFQLLRSILPPTAIITAATQEWPFADSSGNPTTDVSAFAHVLDWILIMNYDVWSSSATPGPNAPLSNACGDSSQPLANAETSVKSWTDAGFPANQITLGVPSYGYVSKSTATKLMEREVLDPIDLTATSIAVVNEDGSTGDGQVQFAALVSQGALVEAPGGEYIGSSGFVKMWDNCSSTPYLRSAVHQQVITYDDPESLLLKAQFAKEAGIKGVNMFDAHGDTASWTLVDALRTGLGLPAT